MLDEDLVLKQILKPQQSHRNSRYHSRETIVSMPLDFTQLPVDIISKEFTKLNSPHPYRIHYLGPRLTNTQVLHRKFSWQENSQICHAAPDRQVPKYGMETNKIVNSFIANEKLRSGSCTQSEVFYRAFEGMNPTLDLDNSFVFNSAFQSGNLDCVIEYKPQEFDCFLHVDSNTRGHSQWFYFSVKNGNKMGKIRLNICNISKAGTLYETGMHPYFFSKQLHRKRNINWCLGNRNITNVTFSCKQYNYSSVLSSKIGDRAAYCLSFDYEFEEEEDQVFFAYCIPYTYSQMVHDIAKLPRQCVCVHPFGRSLTGLSIPLLHITNPSVCNEKKKNVVITGRIHPGESNGSHVLKGFIDFLCSNDKQAIELRRRVNVYVIPMINPDGVVLGNSRSSAAGRDLNRVFTDANNQLHPEIFQLKLFISRLLQKRSVLLYFDYHGHSRKKNTFFYGPTYPLSDPNYYKCRVLPKIIERNNNAFRYHSCLFGISESKKATGRACMFEYYQIPYAYTIETSIGYFYDSEKLKTWPFNKEIWAQMGKSICQGLSTFVQAYEEYQLFLEERRVLRQTKKQQKLSSNGKHITARKPIVEDQFELETSNTTKKSIMKLAYNGNNLFMKLLEQVKLSDCSLNTLNYSDQPLRHQEFMIDLDADLSSDDHDDNEDYSPSKLQEFQSFVVNADRGQLCNSPPRERRCEGLSRKVIRTGKSEHQNIKLSKRSQINEEQITLFEQLIRKSQSPLSKHRRTAMPGNRSKAIRINAAQKLSQGIEPQESLIKNLNFCISVDFEPERINSERFKAEPAHKGTSFTKSAKPKMNGCKKAQFSQINFPDTDLISKDQMEVSKCLSQQSKNRKDLFRGIRRNRKCEEKAAKLLRYQYPKQSDCHQFKIIKLEGGLQSPVSSHNLTQNEKQTAINSVNTADKPDKLQNKISELMASLQNRSRILKHSVKCRELIKGNASLDHNTKFSFYCATKEQGMKKKISNHISYRFAESKRQLKNYSVSVVEDKESVFRKSFQPMHFTVRNMAN